MPADPKAARRSPMEHPRHQYPGETAALRHIALSCGLTEHIKWGKPCFTHNNSNVALIQRFNGFVALLFFQGAQLSDPDHLLHRIGENTQTARQLRFTSTAQITGQTPAIQALFHQALALAQSGKKSPRTPVSSPDLPAELAAALQADPALHQAFFTLTPGRQRGYVLHIAAARQSSTRAARVARITPAILAGKGLHD